MRDLAERFEIVKRALAEAGYPGAADMMRPVGRELVGPMMPGVPMAVWWQALWLSDPDDMPCWACWSSPDIDGANCRAGRCESPDGPEAPHSELLRGPR